MLLDFHTITLRLPLRLGWVNCYLLKTSQGFVLIDTGSSNQGLQLEEKILALGCQPGSLDLILLTHGDFDHTGNAAFLRRAFGSKIAMHKDDAGIAERGDMFYNRRQPNALIRILSQWMFGFGKARFFSPDLLVDESSDLQTFGLDARIVRLPGHSSGSIGLITADGDLFCGDLLDNSKKPDLNTIMDDLAAALTSLERLQSLNIRKVYPGHGSPFTLAELSEVINPAAQF